MKKFRMKLPPYIVVLLALGALCGIAAVVFNALKFNGVLTVPVTILLVLLIVLALVLTARCAGVLLYPYYVVGKGKLFSRMGLLRTSYDVNDITELIYYKSHGKLVMYTNTDKFIVLLLAESKHEDFIRALREENPKILYDNKINETD